MHIHEYQAKALFQRFNIPAPNAILIDDFANCENACRTLGGTLWVVKAQVHTGGRGKGGGVILCDSIANAVNASKKLLGGRLKTAQTGENNAGLPINQVLIEAGADISAEYYLSLLIDRQTQRITVLASCEGGTEIEKISVSSPEAIIKFGIPPLEALKTADCQTIGARLGLSGAVLSQFCDILLGLYQLFTQKDASLIEINPLIQTTNGDLLALDGKIEFDDNALYRHPDIYALKDVRQTDENVEIAANYGLNYLSLGGTIGCMVNGAGLAMATMDLIAHHGGTAANFLDVGGGTSSEAVAKAVELIEREANVRGILINIFGGIVRCDLIARGILSALEKSPLKLPIVVRLEGTNAREGLDLLARSGINIHTESDLGLAARKIVALAGNSTDESDNSADKSGNSTDKSDNSADKSGNAAEKD